MAMAHDVHDVYKALGMNQYNEQNVMFADDGGSIAYVRNGATPIRPAGYDGARGSRYLVGDGLERHSSNRRPGAHLQSAAGLYGELHVSPANMMVSSTLTPDKYPKYIYNVSWDNQNPRSKRAIQLLDPDHPVTEKAKAMCMDVHEFSRTRGSRPCGTR